MKRAISLITLFLCILNVGFVNPPPLAEAIERPATDGAKINQIIEEYGGEWHIYIENLSNRQVLYQRATKDQGQIASIVKAPIAMLFFARMESEGITGAQILLFIRENGREGLNFYQLLRAMLAHSDEGATWSLLDYLYQPGFNPSKRMSEWGFAQTNLIQRTSTVEEVAKILKFLWDGEGISPQARQILLHLMAEYTDEDLTRLGVLWQFHPEAQIYNQRGSIADETPVVADAGVVVCGDNTLLFVLVGYPDAKNSNYNRIEKTLEKIVSVFGERVCLSREDVGSATVRPMRFMR